MLEAIWSLYLERVVNAPKEAAVNKLKDDLLDSLQGNSEDIRKTEESFNMALYEYGRECFFAGLRDGINLMTEIKAGG